MPEAEHTTLRDRALQAAKAAAADVAQKMESRRNELVEQQSNWLRGSMVKLFGERVEPYEIEETHAEGQTFLVECEADGLYFRHTSAHQVYLVSQCPQCGHMRVYRLIRSLEELGVALQEERRLCLSCRANNEYGLMDARRRQDAADREARIGTAIQTFARGLLDAIREEMSK